MTRSFNTKAACEKCGYYTTLETPFERWMRNEPQLESRSGLVRFDIDLLLHRYKFNEIDKRGSRDIQCLMFVEIKTFNAQLSLAQQDTLSLLNQVLRNRKTNVNAKKRGRHLRDHTPLGVAYSFAGKRTVSLRMYGGHLLTLSGDDPKVSSQLTWDNKEITYGTLINLLRFDVDPDSPSRAIDWRRRYSDFRSQNQQQTLFQ